VKRGIVVAFLCMSSLASAAGVDLPKMSPGVKVTQTIGLTDVSIAYSSPAVRGRPIWGSLVKWDQVWRAGADEATKLTFSRDVIINRKVLLAGAYALFVIPHKSGPWTVVLNKDATQYGADHYDAKLDVVSVDVTPEPAPFRERLTYLFSNFDDDGARLDLEWEKLRVSVPIALRTREQVTENIARFDRAAWHMFNEVAVYQLEQRKDYDAALTWVDRSLKEHEDWFNTWTKAQILAARGQYREAAAWAQKAAALGQTWPGYKNHADDVKRAIQQWSSKS
jgi:tetratricopeptide (TPR) repeat protein